MWPAGGRGWFQGHSPAHLPGHTASYDWEVAEAQETSPCSEQDETRQGLGGPLPSSLGRCPSDSAPGTGGPMGSRSDDTRLCGRRLQVIELVCWADGTSNPAPLDSFFFKPVPTQSLPKSFHCLGDVRVGVDLSPLNRWVNQDQRGRRFHDATANKLQGRALNRVHLNLKPRLLTSALRHPPRALLEYPDLQGTFL